MTKPSYSRPMPPAADTEEAADTPPRHFLTTHWSVVVAAKQKPSTEADAALERLCKTYWWPLYAFVRRRGYPEHDAQDLTQEFFTRLLAKDFLRDVDRSKGKFRSFLLAAMEHFLAKEWRRANAQKRGGGCNIVSADAATTETHYLQLSANTRTPEQLFDQQWAMTLLDRAVARLRDEFVTAGKEGQFKAVKVFLTGEKHSYADLATQLGTTEAALKMAVSRMRQRYGELLYEEVVKTVERPDDAKEELRAVLAALS